jgi:hypothetical protein
MSRVFYKEGSDPSLIRTATGGRLGTSTLIWTDRQDFELGDETDGSNGSVLRYVKASGALAAGNCAVNASNEAAAGNGYKIQSAAKAGQFGWVVKERA